MKYLKECAVVSSMSDEEDDLELLRKAALQTLKKTLDVAPSIKGVSSPLRARGRGGYHRNGQFSNGRKLTNLIAIPTISNIEHQEDKLFKDVMSKLISSSRRSPEKDNTKFSRYNDKSDDTDSEHSDEEKGGINEILNRSNSLEALMQELEHEITGDKKPKEEKLSLAKPHAQPILLKCSLSSSLSDSNSDIDDDALLLLDSTQEDIEEEFKATLKESGDGKTDGLLPLTTSELPTTNNAPAEDQREESVKDEAELARRDTRQSLSRLRKISVFKSRSDNSMPLKRSPYRRINTPSGTTRRVIYSKSFEYQNGPPYQHATSYPPAVPPFGLPLSSHNPLRPLSPLRLDAEALSTIAMAPLSPRSAAFVLQNREIIEKRKRSPRRYSRSPTSPRIRRSKSPAARRQRSPTPPRRQRLSMSPKRASPRRVTKSSPVRRGGSPTDPRRRWSQRVDQKRDSNNSETMLKKRATISERLCDKSRINEYSVQEMSRKKFEEHIIIKDGLIRLKSKSAADDGKLHKDGSATPPPPVVEPAMENINEEPADDEDMINTHIDDIFFDEESDKEGENEGRFKSLTRTSNSTKIVPFTQLANKLTADICSKPLPNDLAKPHVCEERHRTRHESRKDRSRRRHHSPLAVSVVAEKRRRVYGKEMLPRKLTNTPPEANHLKRSTSNKKTSMVSMNISKDKKSKAKETTARRVAIAKDCKDVSLKKNDTENVVVTVADDIGDQKDAEKKTEAADLRVQLSRKRAERQHHHKPTVKHAAVQSRLLHNALDAVLSKAVTRKKTEKTGHNERISIHLRLGTEKGSQLSDKKGKRSTNQV